MLKKIFIIGAVVALTGCATHRQSNELAGAAVGGIIGNAIGGRGGAAVGAVIGAGVGGSQPTERVQPVYIERPTYTERQIIERRSTPPYIQENSCRIFIERMDRCEFLQHYSDRRSCRIDAHNHYENCMTRRLR